MISYMITLHKLFSHMIKCRSEFAFFRMPNMIHTWGSVIFQDKTLNIIIDTDVPMRI